MKKNIKDPKRRKKFDDEIIKIKKFIQKEKFDRAEERLLVLEFQVENLKAFPEETSG